MLCSAAAPAQRIYNHQLDAAAQQALEAVRKIDTRDLFDRQLENLSRLSRRDFETALSGIRRRTRDRIQQWTTWCHVNIEMARVAIAIQYPGAGAAAYRRLYAQRLNVANTEEVQARVCGDLMRELKSPDAGEPANASGWKQRIDELEGQKRELQKKVDGLKNPLPDKQPAIAAVFDKLSDIQDAEDAIAGIKDSPWAGKLGALLDPATTTVQILARLNDAHVEFQKHAADIKSVRQELRELQADMMKIAVERLAAEQEHLNRLLEIESRRVKDLEDAASSLFRYRTAVLCAARRHPGLELMEIDGSLRQLGEAASQTPVPGFELLHREAVELAALGRAGDDPLSRCSDYPLRWTVQQASRALFDAASVEARAEMPGYISALRRAQEEQRYSIVRSAVEARSYQALVRTGVQRLALLHAGGIRPEQLAQLVLQAGQLIGIGAIAAQ
jgi:hypothetical protein